MAGHPPIGQETERTNTVTPKTELAEKYLNPMHDHHNETNIEDAVENWDDGKDLEAMAKKFEELETRVAEQFEKDGAAKRDEPPTIKAPSKPIQEEWEKHQTTHTPYAAWCKHCVLARNVRRNHPSHGRRGKFVPDVERDDGPTNVSLDTCNYTIVPGSTETYRVTHHIW